MRSSKHPFQNPGVFWGFGLLIISVIDFSTEWPSDRGKREICRNGRLLCGNVCYDTDIYSCHESYNGRRKFLCDLTEQTCGDKCYDPADSSCYGSGEDAVACVWSERQCGRKCYDPKKQKCQRGFISSLNTNLQPKRTDRNKQQQSYGQGQSSDNGYQCSGSLRYCGERCYNPSRQICFQKTYGIPNSRTLLCQKNEKRCGNQCYDPNKSFCPDDDDDDPYPQNFEDNRNSYVNVNQNTNRCSWGHSWCENQRRCYNPTTDDCYSEVSYNFNKNKNTENNKGTSSINGNAFGSGSKRNPVSSASSSRNPNLSSSSSRGCRSGLSKCGLECYDPNVENCYGSKISRKTSSASNNNQNGRERKHCDTGKEACGNKCYDSFTQRCFDDGANGKVVCRWNQRACGGRCYDPYKENCGEH